MRAGRRGASRGRAGRDGRPAARTRLGLAKAVRVGGPGRRRAAGLLSQEANVSVLLANGKMHEGLAEKSETFAMCSAPK